MNGLIRIRSTVASDLYIPVNSIKEVARTSVSEISIITEPVFMNRSGTFNAPGYVLGEATPGAGLLDTNNVQAIIDAWTSVLRGQQSIATVNFSFPIRSVTRAMIAWP